jgi:DNA transposition AAA+ family ATPase
LKSIQTRQLIIDDADFLSFEALSEIAQIYDDLKIPSILCGTYYLEKRLQQRYWDRIGNSFLDFYEYPPMSQDEVVEVIDTWETEFLQWPEESDLLIEDVLKAVYVKTGGLRDALNEVLRKVAIQAVEQDSCKITAEIIVSVLNGRVQPRIKPAQEE